MGCRQCLFGAIVLQDALPRRGVVERLQADLEEMGTAPGTHLPLARVQATPPDGRSESATVSTPGKTGPPLQTSKSRAWTTSSSNALSPNKCGATSSRHLGNRCLVLLEVAPFWIGGHSTASKALDRGVKRLPRLVRSGILGNLERTERLLLLRGRNTSHSAPPSGKAWGRAMVEGRGPKSRLFVPRVLWHDRFGVVLLSTKSLCAAVVTGCKRFNSIPTLI